MPRFIHCADVHLGRSIRAHIDMPEHFINVLQDAAYESFRRIIDNAIQKKVDFVLVSGDLYDLEQRSLRGQWFVKKQAERLHKNDIPLFIIHGNHDPIMNAQQSFAMPNNVHVFNSEVTSESLLTKDNEKVYIYGFSYPNKAFYDNPVPSYSRVLDDSAYHIGLLHGQERMQQEHDPYAPFQVSELVEKGFDYWALGHIHKRQVLSHRPPIVYPGNVQGSHRKETGEKGAYYVEMSKGSTELTLLDTSPVQWERAIIKIDSLHTMEEIFDELDSLANELASTKQYLIDLTVEGHGNLHEQLHETNDQELLQLLKESVYHRSNVWIDRVEVRTTPSFDREKLLQQDHLIGDVVRTVDKLKETKEINQALKPVTHHQLLKKYINSFSNEEMDEILESAERNLLSVLLSEVEKG